MGYRFYFATSSVRGVGTIDEHTTPVSKGVENVEKLSPAERAAKLTASVAELKPDQETAFYEIKEDRENDIIALRGD